MVNLTQSNVRLSNGPQPNTIKCSIIEQSAIEEMESEQNRTGFSLIAFDFVRLHSILFDWFDLFDNRTHQNWGGGGGGVCWSLLETEKPLKIYVKTEKPQ